MDDPELPWGSLPIEQYLIQHWNDSATESPAEQRLQLISEFLNLDEFPAQWVPVDGEPNPETKPTAAQIETILQPWRPLSLRKKAWEILYSNKEYPLLLRTHYSPDPPQRSMDDEKIEEWAHASEMLQDRLDWAYLNDPTLFNFGPDWHRIYEIMPEAAGPMDGSGVRKQEPSDLSLPQFKDALREHKHFEEWKEDKQKYIENMASSMQRDVTAAYMLIADEEAFETDHLRLLYVDYKLNIIRESRVEADGQWITDLIMDWDQAGMLDEFWERGIGEKYRVDGELGAPLYQLTEEDWADPENAETPA
ncbi:hypothetical protein ASPWEDRAFT_118459 [Aspergillus wentii DTO 134E9]|uniref:Uncharacterized protein n=1 Tax=Aspergillus wentii DTO 134E9 TaxID=1073089 RepID=A0A1L9R7B9_ASPWE|nr:uncharacterized protein ASPWEDRAFT_118459 [Aspergillus wentii DTO 134E9]OJJ30809.1 hypothetical protein ASPWEDRAFT_118459 [Aspergillus wentii DTO 134E9]